MEPSSKIYYFLRKVIKSQAFFCVSIPFLLTFLFFQVNARATSCDSLLILITGSQSNSSAMNSPTKLARVGRPPRAENILFHSKYIEPKEIPEIYGWLNEIKSRLETARNTLEKSSSSHVKVSLKIADNPSVGAHLVLASNEVVFTTGMIKEISDYSKGDQVLFAKIVTAIMAHEISHITTKPHLLNGTLQAVELMTDGASIPLLKIAGMDPSAVVANMGFLSHLTGEAEKLFHAGEFLEHTHPETNRIRRGAVEIKLISERFENGILAEGPVPVMGRVVEEKLKSFIESNVSNWKFTNSKTLDEGLSRLSELVSDKKFLNPMGTPVIAAKEFEDLTQEVYQILKSTPSLTGEQESLVRRILMAVHKIDTDNDALSAGLANVRRMVSENPYFSSNSHLQWLKDELFAPDFIEKYFAKSPKLSASDKISFWNKQYDQLRNFTSPTAVAREWGQKAFSQIISSAHADREPLWKMTQITKDFLGRATGRFTDDVEYFLANERMLFEYKGDGIAFWHYTADPFGSHLLRRLPKNFDNLPPELQESVNKYREYLGQLWTNRGFLATADLLRSGEYDWERLFTVLKIPREEALSQLERATVAFHESGGAKGWLGYMEANDLLKVERPLLDYSSVRSQIWSNPFYRKWLKQNAKEGTIAHSSIDGKLAYYQGSGTSSELTRFKSELSRLNLSSPNEIVEHAKTFIDRSTGLDTTDFDRRVQTLVLDYIEHSPNISNNRRKFLTTDFFKFETNNNRVVSALLTDGIYRNKLELYRSAANKLNITVADYLSSNVNLIDSYKIEANQVIQRAKLSHGKSEFDMQDLLSLALDFKGSRNNATGFITNSEITDLIAPELNRYSFSPQRAREIFMALSSQGGTAELDQFFKKQLLPTLTSGKFSRKELTSLVLQRDSLGKWSANRIADAELRLDFSKAIVDEELKAFQKTGKELSKEHFEDLVNLIGDFVPETSASKDELLESILWDFKIVDLDRIQFVEAKKAGGDVLAEKSKAINAASSLTYYLDRMPEKTRAEFMEFIIKPNGRPVPESMRTFLKEQSSEEYTKGFISNYLSVSDEKFETVSDQLLKALNSMAGIYSPLERVPFVYGLLTTGENRLTSDLVKIRAFLDRNLQIPIGSMERKMFNAYLAAVPEHERLFSVAYLLTMTAQKGGKDMDVIEMVKVFQQVGFKGGQMAADWNLFPHITERLTELKDSAPKMTKMQVMRNLEKNVGPEMLKDIEVLDTLGSASMKNIVRIKYKGEYFATALARPNGPEKIKANLAIGKRFIEELKKEGVDVPNGLAQVMIRDMESQMLLEADLTNEVKNMKKAASYYEQLNKYMKDKFGWTFAVPKVDARFPVTKDFYVMQIVDGKSWEKLGGMAKAEKDQLGQGILNAETHGLFNFGFFDGDRQNRNYLIDVNRKIINAIDFGQADEFSTQERVGLANFFRFLNDKNSDRFMETVKELNISGSGNFTKARQEIVDFLNAKAVGGSRRDLSDEAIRVLDILAQNDIYFSRKINIVGITGLAKLSKQQFAEPRVFELAMSESIRSLLTKPGSLVREAIGSLKSKVSGVFRKPASIPNGLDAGGNRFESSRFGIALKSEINKGFSKEEAIRNSLIRIKALHLYDQVLVCAP